jgi:hypothetical protein
MPDCDRCSHPHEVHQHYRTNMTDDCGMLSCPCPGYRHPPGRLLAWARRWLW